MDYDMVDTLHIRDLVLNVLKKNIKKTNWLKEYTMTNIDFENAYILLLSGAAKLNQHNEIEWKSEYGSNIYISFPNFPDSNQVIVKTYNRSGNKRLEEKYLNGKLHGKSIGYYSNGEKTGNKII